MPQEQKGSAVVIVGGTRYDRMLSLNLKRSREESTCSGTIVLSWPGAEHFNTNVLQAAALMSGADGVILLDDQLAATIVIDARLSKATPKQYELTLQFRGKASAIVDSTPQHDTGQENNKSPVQIMQSLLKGSGVGLQDMSGGGAAKQIKRFIVASGETTERAMRRAGREHSLTFNENERGMIEVHGQNGTEGMGSGVTLIAGRDFTQWQTKLDLSPRADEIEAMGNAIPTDENYGENAENVSAQNNYDISESGNRTMRHHVDGDHDNQSMQGRNDLEGARRAGQAMNVQLRMSTWSDEGGALWAVNRTYTVIIPIDNVNGPLVCSEVEFELSPDTRAATLVLQGDGVVGGAGDVLFDKKTNQPIAPEDPNPQPPGPDDTLSVEERQRQYRENLRRRRQERPIPGPG